MAQILAMAVNDGHNGWDSDPPHTEFAYNTSVSFATDLVPNQVHISRFPRFSLAIFYRPNTGGHQILDCDQLAQCDLAIDHQRRSCNMVHEQHALVVSCVERRNSQVSNAGHNVSQFAAGGWVWVYKTAAIIRQGACKELDDSILKAKLSLN